MLPREIVHCDVNARPGPLMGIASYRALLMLLVLATLFHLTGGLHGQGSLFQLVERGLQLAAQHHPQRFLRLATKSQVARGYLQINVIERWNTDPGFREGLTSELLQEYRPELFDLIRDELTQQELRHVLADPKFRSIKERIDASAYLGASKEFQTIRTHVSADFQALSREEGENLLVSKGFDRATARSIAESFGDSSLIGAPPLYVGRIREPMALSRLWGDGAKPLGNYFFPSGLENTRERLALPPANVANRLAVIEVPEGTEILFGNVSPAFEQEGGGTQVFIPDSNRKGFRILQSWVLENAQRKASQENAFRKLLKTMGPAGTFLLGASSGASATYLIFVGSE